MPPIRSLTRRLLFLALVVFSALARAQAPTVGAQVFLASPGPVSSTLLAAPSQTDFLWGTAVFFYNNGTAGSGLSQMGDSIGSTRTISSIPNQNGLPLTFDFDYVFRSDIPPGNQQPGDNIPHYFVTTGTVPGSNGPTTSDQFNTVSATAAVVFGANNTAQIGFSPVGTSAGPDITDYPFRIGVTNVFNGEGSVGGIGGGGCTS